MGHGTSKSETERLEYNEKKNTVIPEFKTNKQWCKESGDQITWIEKILYCVCERNSDNSSGPPRITIRHRKKSFPRFIF